MKCDVRPYQVFRLFEESGFRPPIELAVKTEVLERDPRGRGAFPIAHDRTTHAGRLRFHRLKGFKSRLQPTRKRTRVIVQIGYVRRLARLCPGIPRPRLTEAEFVNIPDNRRSPRVFLDD